MWGWNPESVSAVAAVVTAGGLVIAAVAVFVSMAQIESQKRAVRAQVMFQARENYRSRAMLEALEYLMDRDHPERRDPFRYLHLVFVEHDTNLHDARRQISQFLTSLGELVAHGVEQIDLALAIASSAIDYFPTLAPIEYRLRLRTPARGGWALSDLYICYRSLSDTSLWEFRPHQQLRWWQLLLKRRNRRWDKTDSKVIMLRRHKLFFEVLAGRGEQWAEVTVRVAEAPPTEQELPALRNL